MTTAPLLPEFRWHHTSAVVSDLDRAIAFREHMVGAQILFREYGMDTQIQSILGLPGISCDIAQLRIPGTGHVQEFIRFHDLPEALDPLLPVRVGQGHIAYVVDDFAGAIDGMLCAGGRLVGAVTDFDEGPAAYLWAPTGEVIELEGRRRTRS